MRHASVIRFMGTATTALLLSPAHPDRRARGRRPLDVRIAIDSDPPDHRGQPAHRDLRDASGKPVDRAQLAFVYDMPAMAVRMTFTPKRTGEIRYSCAMGMVGGVLDVRRNGFRAETRSTIPSFDRSISSIWNASAASSSRGSRTR